MSKLIRDIFCVAEKYDDILFTFNKDEGLTISIEKNNHTVSQTISVATLLDTSRNTSKTIMTVIVSMRKQLNEVV